MGEAVKKVTFDFSGLNEMMDIEQLKNENAWLKEKVKQLEAENKEIIYEQVKDSKIYNRLLSLYSGLVSELGDLVEENEECLKQYDVFDEEFDEEEE